MGSQIDTFTSRWILIKESLDAYVRSLTNDENMIDEILQLTSITLFEKYSRRNINNEYFKYIAFNIAKKKYFNLARKKSRRRNKEKPLDALYTTYNVKLSTESLFSQLIQDEVFRLVDDLPEYEKRLIRLRFYEGLSYKEMSVILNKSEGALRTSVWRITNQLHDVITGDIKNI